MFICLLQYTSSFQTSHHTFPKRHYPCIIVVPSPLLIALNLLPLLSPTQAGFVASCNVGPPLTPTLSLTLSILSQFHFSFHYHLPYPCLSLLLTRKNDCSSGRRAEEKSHKRSSIIEVLSSSSAMNTRKNNRRTYAEQSHSLSHTRMIQ